MLIVNCCCCCKIAVAVCEQGTPELFVGTAAKETAIDLLKESRSVQHIFWKMVEISSKGLSIPRQFKFLFRPRFFSDFYLLRHQQEKDLEEVKAL